jgi:hypothetical protein
MNADLDNFHRRAASVQRRQQQHIIAVAITDVYAASSGSPESQPARCPD